MNAVSIIRTAAHSCQRSKLFSLFIMLLTLGFYVALVGREEEFFEIL